MERDIILKTIKKTFVARTEFTSEDIDDAVDRIRDNYEDPQDDDRLLRDLETKGYIKILGPAPEVVEIW